MIRKLSILKHHGNQFIPNLVTSLPDSYRGRPIITTAPADEQKLADLCPTGAISCSPLTLDLGKCLFCGECAFRFPEKIIFTNDNKLATNNLQNLIIKKGADTPIIIEKALIRPEIKNIFSKSLKLRQVSAGGDSSTEAELNASSNANFDMGRYGIEFVASPRHADGILITGPLTVNMAEAVKICYDAIPEPKVVILAGTDAISGGMLSESPAIDRSFINNIHIDLYIPGNPPHPLTIVNALMGLTGNGPGRGLF